MSATESTDRYFNASRIHSTQELRTWFEADPADYKVLRGMSCCITRDGQGNITSVKFEATGVVLHV